MDSQTLFATGQMGGGLGAMGAGQPTGNTPVPVAAFAAFGISLNDTRGLLPDTQGLMGTNIPGVFGTNQRAANGMMAKLMASIHEGFKQGAQGIQISPATQIAGMEISAPLATPGMASGPGGPALS